MGLGMAKAFPRRQRPAYGSNISMKNILKLSLAVALAAAFTSSVSAFPYTQPHFGPVYTEAAPTIAVSANGQGVSKQTHTKKHHKSANTDQSSQR